jgi:hypothetical protein
MSGNILFALTVGAVLATQGADTIDGIKDGLSEAIGSLVSGTIGSSVSATTTAIVWVANTVIDRVHHAWYGQLPSANSTWTAPDSYTVRFSLTPRSS